MNMRSGRRERSEPARAESVPGPAAAPAPAGSSRSSRTRPRHVQAHPRRAGVSAALLALGWFTCAHAQTSSPTCGVAQARLDGSVSVLIRRQDEATWAGKQGRFTAALDSAMNDNRNTSNLYSLETTVYSVAEVDQGDRIDLRVHFYAVVNPVGGTFPAAQLVTEARAAQLYVVAAAEVFYALDTVEASVPTECEPAASTTNKTTNDKFIDWHLLGIIIAIGATVILTSLIVVFTACRSSRRAEQDQAIAMRYPGAYATGPVIVNPAPPPPPPATSLAVDFGEAYDDRTMHTHL